MPASFSDLFANDCEISEVPDGAIRHISWRLLVMPEDEVHLPAGFAVVGGGAHPLIRAAGKLWWQCTGRADGRYRYMVFPKSHSRRSARPDARHIDLEYGRIPGYFKNVYLPLFRKIRFRSDILSRADEWAIGRLDRDVIGVQVRTWRDDPRRHRKYHLPAVRRLRRSMRAAPPDKRFFVVSDSDAIIAALRAEFGDERVLAYPRQTPLDQSWHTREGMQEDLIDMLLLARCRRMFVSYLSTFSETAWWLGGASADVSVF